MAYKCTYSNEFYHHGINGQKWGERNGPPYPLAAGNHSAAENKAGWKNSLDKGINKGYNKVRGTPGGQLTDEQKRALAKGAAAVAGTLAVYGAYKAGLLNADTIAMGRQAASSAMDAIGDNPVNVMSGMEEWAKNNAPKPQSPPKPQPDVTEHGFKKLVKPESLRESLQNVNPNRGNPAYQNNCTYCSVTAAIRRKGYNVIAKDSRGLGQNGPGVLENCFKDVKVFEGRGGSYCRSAAEAKAMIIKRCCQGTDSAFGYCDISTDSIGNGHAFNWLYKDGKITFLDFQAHSTDSYGETVDHYWSIVHPEGTFAFARLDNCEPRWEALSEYMESR